MQIANAISDADEDGQKYGGGTKTGYRLVHVCLGNIRDNHYVTGIVLL